MVRMTRFGWSDAGPLARPLDDAPGFDDEDDLDLPPRSAPRRRRGPHCRTSPIDPTPPRNQPPTAESQRAA
jgi:hypothetical protein